MKAPSAKRAVGLDIEVPTENQDRLHLGRVGAIAVVGFVVGLLGPRLAGSQFAPTPPAEQPEPERSTGGKGRTTTTAKPAATPAVAPPTPSKPQPSPEDRVTVGDFQVTSCRDREGETRSQCDTIHLGALAEGRLEALGACEAAGAAEGVLSLGVDIDFDRNRVVDFKNGKSTTLAPRTARALIECAKKEFTGADFAGIEHQYPQYTVFYLVTFAPPKDPLPESGSSEETIQASGRATVSWHVALVREAPKDGAIVARLLGGTRVVVTGRRGDWCRIQYDAKGREGWVYRTAIGL